MLAYRTVGGCGSTEITLKKSRFIASVFPAATERDALGKIGRIRKEHRKANHNVFAFMVGIDAVVARCSDDGEPAGTAGPVLLELLRKEALYNTVVVVTRYFGGTLLGAGGLIRAYGKAAKAGIEEAGTIWQVLHQQFVLEYTYGWQGQVQNFLSGRNYYPFAAAYTDNVRMQVMVPKVKAEGFRAEILELTNGQIRIGTKGEVYLGITADIV